MSAHVSAPLLHIAALACTHVHTHSHPLDLLTPSLSLSPSRSLSLSSLSPSEYRDSRKIPLNWEHRLMLGMAPDYDHLPVIHKVGWRRRNCVTAAAASACSSMHAGANLQQHACWR